MFTEHRSGHSITRSMEIGNNLIDVFVRDCVTSYSYHQPSQIILKWYRNIQSQFLINYIISLFKNHSLRTRTHYESNYVFLFLWIEVLKLLIEYRKFSLKYRKGIFVNILEFFVTNIIGKIIRTLKHFLLISQFCIQNVKFFKRRSL